MLEKISDPSLRVYVVWLPILEGDAEQGAAEMTGSIPDSRAIQFWDQDQRLGKVYAKVLGLPTDQLAWDVYLLFPKGARWEADVPVPAFWMHQLSYPSENYLDGERFRAEVERLLKSTPGSPRAGLLSIPDRWALQGWSTTARRGDIERWKGLYHG